MEQSFDSRKHWAMQLVRIDMREERRVLNPYVCQSPKKPKAWSFNEGLGVRKPCHRCGKSFGLKTTISKNGYKHTLRQLAYWKTARYCSKKCSYDKTTHVFNQQRINQK